MSILQCSVFAHSVIVGADTKTDWRSIEANERVGLGFASKMAVVPHLPAIMAVRGELNLLHTPSGGMLMAPSFDDWIRDFVETVEQIRALMGSTKPVVKSALDADAELVLAGWSAGARRLRAFHAGKPAGEMFTLTEIYSEAWAPLPHADDATRLDPQTVEDRVRLARLQVERIRNESNGVAGGDLCVATLTRDGVSVLVAAPSLWNRQHDRLASSARATSGEGAQGRARGGEGYRAD